MNLHLDNLKSSEAAPLYERYKGQHKPQRASITITEDGDVYAEVSGNVGGGTTPDKWHGRTIEISVPPLSNGASVAAVLESAEGSVLLNLIHEGHSVEWDGHNNVGTLDEDAQAAISELEDILSDVTLDEVHEVDAYLCDQPFSELWKGDQTLSKAEDTILSGLDSQSDSGGLVCIYGDIEEHLLERALEIVENEEDGLSQTHLDALVEAGRIDQDEAKEYAAEHIQTTGLKM